MRRDANTNNHNEWHDNQMMTTPIRRTKRTIYIVIKIAITVKVAVTIKYHSC